MDTDMATTTKVHSEFRSFERVIFHPKPQWEDWSDQFWLCFLKVIYIYIYIYSTMFGKTWHGNNTTPRPVRKANAAWLFNFPMFTVILTRSNHNTISTGFVKVWNKACHHLLWTGTRIAQLFPFSEPQPIRKKRPMMQVSCRCFNIWHEAARSTDSSPVASINDKSITKNRSTMALSRKHLGFVSEKNIYRTWYGDRLCSSVFKV